MRRLLGSATAAATTPGTAPSSSRQLRDRRCEQLLEPAGGLNAAGRVFKVDPGTIVFPLDPDPNTQLLTVIEEATLQVDGTIGNVRYSGGTLSGNGTVQAISSTTGGRVNPGDNYPDALCDRHAQCRQRAVLNNTNVIAVNSTRGASPTHDLLQLTATSTWRLRHRRQREHRRPRSRSSRRPAR